ncbi:hypothetical protein ACFQL4_09705 [Halosimplex aquaticum]
MAEDTTRSAFMDWICRRQLLWISLLALTLVHLVIAVMAATAIEPGSANYYVLLMDFGSSPSSWWSSVSSSGAAATSATRRCTDRLPSDARARERRVPVTLGAEVNLIVSV